jgi:PHD/YefM family antitoxin component YafN of YafNO toxin-antitoxin module
MIEQAISNESQTFDENPISRLNLTEVYENLEKIISAVKSGEQRIIIHQGEKDIAAIISMDEFLLLERVIQDLENKIDLEAFQKAKAEDHQGEVILWEDLKEELGI